MLKKVIATSLIVICLFAFATAIRPVFPTGTQQIVSVVSDIIIESGGAYSSWGYSSDLAELPAVRDCLRPFPIDCFSIQQNFWIDDQSGEPVFWARNIIYLASLGGTYHGTYSFQLYSRDNRVRPVICEPRSNSTSTCRSPFYVDYSPFPQTFKFYAHISRSNLHTTLQMANNFGAVAWELPSTLTCPCSIAATSNSSQAWGTWPYELVAVGIDNTASATFRNDTKGTMGSTVVQTIDGSWHQTSLGVLGCVVLEDCLRQLSTQETSMGLRWNTDRALIYWSKDALDQGVHITGVLPAETTPPILPTPRNEDYLYLEFSSAIAYMAVYDSSRRLAGINPQTGRPETTLPNSSLVLGSYIPVKDTPANVPEEEVLIVNPRGTYQIVVTAGGNTAYDIFLSKVTSRNEVLATNSYEGSLIIGDSETLQVDAGNLTITANPQRLSVGILSMAAIIITLISFVSLVLLLLARRRRRLLRLRPDYDELR